MLGLGLIGMAEDLGTAMAHRALEHLLQYGDPAVRYCKENALQVANGLTPHVDLWHTGLLL